MGTTRITQNKKNMVLIDKELNDEVKTILIGVGIYLINYAFVFLLNFRNIVIFDGCLQLHQ